MIVGITKADILTNAAKETGKDIGIIVSQAFHRDLKRWLQLPRS